MAQDRVEIPIDLTVDDIKTNKVTGKSLNAAMDSIVKDMNKKLRQIGSEDTMSVFRKRFTNEMKAFQKQATGFNQMRQNLSARTDKMERSSGVTKNVKETVAQYNRLIEKTNQMYATLEKMNRLRGISNGVDYVKEQATAPFTNMIPTIQSASRAIGQEFRNAFANVSEEFAQFAEVVKHPIINLRDFVGELQRMRAESNAVQGTSMSFAELTNRIDNTRRVLEATMESLSGDSLPDIVRPEMEQHVREYIQELQEYLAMLEQLRDNADPASADYESYQIACDSLRDYLTELSALSPAEEEVEEKEEQHTQSLNLLGGAAKVASGAFKILSKTVKFYGTAILAPAKFTAKFAKQLAGMGKDSSPHGKTGKGFKNILKNIMMFGFGFRSLYFLVKRLRKMVTDQLGAMAKGIPAINKQMTDFTNATRGLQGALGSAFQPIASVILPLLTSLVNMLISAGNALANFFAVLTGQGWVAKATVQQKDYAASLNKSSGAAKELRKQLMGFDEINRLDDDSGSGGGGGTDSGISYEQGIVDTENALAQLAAEIRRLWTTGEFGQIGTLVGNTLKDLLNKFDTYSLGATVGVWVNRFVAIINRFTDTKWWATMGTKLAQGVNGLLSEVDGFKLGRLLIGKFQTLFGIAANFLNELNFAQAGSVLGSAIFGAVSGLRNFFNSTLTDEFWTKLNENIRLGFDSFEPGFIAALQDAVDLIVTQLPNVLGTLGTIGTELFKVLNDSLAKLNEPDEWIDDWGRKRGSGLTAWQKLGESIASGISGIDWKLALTTAGEAFSNLTHGLLTMLLTAAEGVEWEQLGRSIAAGISSIKWGTLIIDINSLIDSIMIGFAEAILGFIDEITGDAWQLTKKFDDFIARRNIQLGLTSGLMGMHNAGQDTTLNFQEYGNTRAMMVTPEFFNEMEKSYSSLVTTAATGERMFMYQDDDGKYVVFLEDVAGALATVTEKSEPTKEAVDGVTEAFEESTDAALATPKGASAVSEFNNQVVPEVQEVTNEALECAEALNALSLYSSGGHSGHSGSFAAPKLGIPKLAQGSVLPPNNPFLALVGDQKRGTNVEAPLSTIQQAVATENSKMIQGLQSGLASAIMDALKSLDLSADVYLDGRQITDSVTMYQRRNARAFGG